MAHGDNVATGRGFELMVKHYFEAQKVMLERPFVYPIGVNQYRKEYHFDLGSEEQKVVVECKAHTWTRNGNAPSAKLSAWNEAMYYFSLVSKEYVCKLFVLRSMLAGRSLAEYYVARFFHLIPAGVEIWEYDGEGARFARVEVLPM